MVSKMMRRSIALSLAGVLVVSGCSRRESAPMSGSSTAPPGAAAKVASVIVRSEDQVCELLTPEEIRATLNWKTSPRRLPKAGEYGAPECGWFVSDAPNAMGISVLLFIHAEPGHGKESFADKMNSMCRGTQRQELQGVGDEAVLCRGFWVRKKDVYFCITLRNVVPDAGISWRDADTTLARYIMARLP
jgi:hypothetical protein